jgi:hypothetical protein
MGDGATDYVVLQTTYKEEKVAHRHHESIASHRRGCSIVVSFRRRMIDEVV